MQLVKDNSTRLVKDFKYKSEGFHTWTPQEVEQYEKGTRWAQKPGSRSLS